MAGNHLGSGVAGRTTGRLQIVSLLVEVGQAEVDYLECFVVVNQQILRLEITVTYTELVNVADATDKFLEVLACRLFVEFLILDNQVEQLAALHKLHHQIQVFFRFDYLIYLHNVWMMKLLEDFDLAADSLDVLLISYTALLEYLYGHLHHE